MPGKLLWIVNPHAGKAEIGQHVLACIDCFVRAGWEVTVYTTQTAKDARRAAGARAADFDRVVCAGGDGTLGEVVSGVMDAGTRVPLGYIPAGTTNDFASSLGLPRVPVEAAKIAAGEHLTALDIGRFGEQYFTYVAAFGLFTDVSYTTPQSSKNLLGRMAYLLEGIKSLSQIREYRLRVTAPEVETEGAFIFGMVSNSTSVGGFKGLPVVAGAQMDDGLFEVVLVRRATSLLDLQTTVNNFLSGDDFDPGLVVHFKAPWVRIAGEEETAWTLDGEFGGSVAEAEIWNLHHAVSMLTPPASGSSAPKTEFLKNWESAVETSRNG